MNEEELSQEAEVTEADNSSEDTEDQYVSKEKYEKTRIALKEARKAARSIPEDLDKVVEDKVHAMMSSRIEDDVEETLNEVSKDADEETRNKVKEIYKSRITKTGYGRSALRRDLEDAFLLANKDKFLSQAQKAAQKSVAEMGAMKMASSAKVAPAKDDSEYEDWSQFSDQEKALMKRSGLKPSQIKRN